MVIYFQKVINRVLHISKLLVLNICFKTILIYKYPQFIMGVLAQVKNVLGLACSLQVPNEFSICSLGLLCVPQGCSQQHLALIPYVAYLKHVPKLTTTCLTLNPLPHSQKCIIKMNLYDSNLITN